MAGSDVAFTAENGSLKATYLSNQESVTLPTEHWLVALITNVFAQIFPCYVLGSLEIKVQDETFYISRSQLQPTFQWNGQGPCDNENDLKQIALSYFTKGPERSDHVSHAKDILSTAERLTKKFMELKDKTKKCSGYCVNLTSADSKSFHLKINPCGQDNQDIAPPSLAFSAECQCCNTGFEHSYKAHPNELCKELTAKIEKYDMFAVFSYGNRNLLLVPDTRRPHIKKDQYRHLFQLDEEKLKKVFSAALEALDFIKKKAPSYQPDIEWHVGKDGYQTVWVLHTRVQQLPHDLRK